MRIAVLSTTVCSLLVSLCVAGDVRAAIRMPTNIPAQPLGAALKALAETRDLQVLYLSETVRNGHTAGATGDLTADEALTQLLRGTGLTYRYVDENAVTILNEQTAPPPAKPAPAVENTQSQEVRQKSLWQRFRLAQVAAAPNPQSTAVNPGSGAEPTRNGSLEELIVTASKRPEALREVANSVTAFNGEQLVEQGANSFQDYLGRAPGVIFQGATPGVANVTIRGIGTATIYPDQGQATTGIYLNDIPLTDPGFAVSVPDLDIFDVQRVEVLRGPQGTLFGSATLGGAVNYILNPVSLTSFDAVTQFGASQTKSSSDLGYAAKAAANIPIVNDVFGIRLTAIKRSDAGYLDNIGTGRKDVNSHDVEAGRVNALWQINPNISLNLFSFYDRAKNGDAFYAFPELGGLVNQTVVPEEVTFTTRINNLKLDADLGFATLTVSGGMSRKTQDYVSDLSPFYGPVNVSEATARTRSSIGEVRLTSPGNERIDWLVGAYYGWFDEFYPSPRFENGEYVSDFKVAYRSKEYAAFGEVSYRFNDQWRAALGGRSYDINVRTSIDQGDPRVGFDRTAGEQKGTGFSPKVSLTFEPNDSVMTYALVSKGFRMGGVNLVAPIASFPTPATYGSDKLINYELGLRLTSADRTLTFDTAAFFIDWTNIQLRLSRPDRFAYVANAGAAQSKGVESAVQWRPTPGLNLQASVTYLDAALSKSLPLGNGTTLLDGSTLPGASKWSTSASVGYQFATALNPHVTLSHRFLSEADSAFQEPLPVGDYHIVDIRGGLEFGRLGVTAYVNNVADERGVTAAAYTGALITQFYVMPRTLGLQFDWHL
ncbi:TonB-dependent receptor domain-containing protein [Steroidobacter sp.]|uniref:TonB-dependent receptor domain-containing protein n=1 Tax=Steroidobacter sp. TaxID=1978227 RepID=UPI001A3B24B5|nr:TonB-dependent receptor [Steroidobacter sp.]MBL8268884.1 TonB-dependent receptor [Steroidobacter sp.]